MTRVKPPSNPTMAKIKSEYLAGELSYIDAVLRLTALMGYEPKRAEEIVEEWQAGTAPDYE